MSARLPLAAALTALVALTAGPSRANDQHIDPNANIHRHSLTIARHPNAAITIGQATAGANLAGADLLRCDSRVSADQDVACQVEVQVTGAMGTFGTAADGLDVITTAAEMASVLGDNTAYVKVVTSINFCGVALAAVGCAPTPGASICIVNGLGNAVWGETLVHEFGHNKGLNHRDAPGKPFMHTSTFGNNEVSAAECVAYHGGGTVVGPNYPVDVAFVIDDTGSMSEEINGVKNALLTHLGSYPAATCKAFQLTTFKDDVTERKPTTDLTSIQAQVAALSASGGGDCPEASVSALLAAANKVKEGGRFFLATDASPHPGFSLEFVIGILRALGRRVDVILTGTCDGSAPAPAVASANDRRDAPERVTKPPTPYRPARDHAIQARGGPVEIFLGDDDTQLFLMSFTFPFGGEDHSGVYVGSNGYVTFGSGDTDFSPWVLGLLTGPRRIAPIWTDLNPSAGGTVTVEDTGTEFRVVFDAVPLYGSTATVSYSLVLRPNGTFGVDYGTVEALYGLSGCSIGTSVPDPGAIDLTSEPQPIEETVAGSGTAYETFTGVCDLGGASLEFAAMLSEPPVVYSTMEAFSLLAVETGGIFAYLPEVNFGSPSDIQRFENVMYNIVQGGIGQSIATLQPPACPEGSAVTVTVTGAGTNFQPGTAVSISGDGVTVGDVTVLSPTVLTADLSVAPGASLGFRDIVAITDLGFVAVDSASGTGSLEIIAAPVFPTILGVTPATLAVGESATVLVHGAATNFDGSSVPSLGAGVVVGTTTALSPTKLQVAVQVSAGATVGFRDVTVVTGGEYAWEDLTGPFFVSSAGTATPVITSVAPTEAAPGNSLTISVTGLNTAFANGISVVSFSGSGIVVNGTTVTSPTSLTADIDVLPEAVSGFRDVRVSTGTEVVALLDGFNVSTTTALERPHLEVTPAAHTFRPVAVGTSIEQTFRIANGRDATAVLRVQDVELAGTGAGPFSLVRGGGSFALAPGEDRDLVVRYAPDVPGEATAELRIASNAGAPGLRVVALSGTAGVRLTSQNFPNPFGPSVHGRSTEIGFQVSGEGRELVPVSLKIYDLSGREVRTLEDAALAPGHYSSAWDGRGQRGERVAAGIYLYRLVVGREVTTRKITVLR